MKMKHLSFGQHLVEKGVITPEQHETALQIQNKNRLLGEISVEMNYLSRDDVLRIMDYMEGHPNVLFGEAAVSLGLINANQLRYLLDIRTRRKVMIGDILLERRFVDEATLQMEVMNFHQKRRKLNNILIVEPSSTVTMALERMIRKYGYNVFKTKSGAEAIKLATVVKADIIMTAAYIGDMSGFDLCYRLLADPDTVGVNLILLSQDDSVETVENAFDHGVNHFLKKPVQEKELINVVYQIERETATRRPEKILVVDDSKGARMVIHKELQSAGFNVYLAENGRDALVKAQKLTPDIITMDIEMPVMDGFEACRALKENASTVDIPVIVISSHAEAKIRERGFEVGAVEFFSKPFKAGRLADYVNMLLETKKIRKYEKILVLEDCNITRHIFKHIFGKNGYNVYTAANVAEAMELLPKCGPDIIVTDCYLPDKDGYEFAREVKKMEAYRHVPIIMVTGAGGREEVLKGLASGASDYILKPFDEAELIARVGAHLLSKKLFDEVTGERNKLVKLNDEKNRFLGMVAHDLRNPVSSINGFAHLLLDDSYAEKRHEIADLIKKTSGEMVGLIDSLLDISAIESGHVALTLCPNDLNPMLETRVKLFGMIATQKGITLNHTPSPIPPFVFDLGKIQQVIDNLISNAIKFTRPGGSVGVTASVESGNVRVEVTDNGVGIPEHEQEHLFTGQKKISVLPTGGERSTGYGLLIAAKIVKAHNGTIGAQSKPGAGSSFFFTLPMEEVAPIAGA
jgi:DNA-binding response OmpR family regulator